MQAMHAFLEFCYITRHNVHDTHSFTALDNVLQQFHYHDIFCTTGICINFNLSRQILSTTMSNSFVPLVLLTAFASPSQNLNISRLWRSHGGAQAVLRRLVRCFLPINALTNLLLLVLILLTGMLGGTCLSALDYILCMCFNHDVFLN